jgi:hypothetical protein
VQRPTVGYGIAIHASSAMCGTTGAMHASSRSVALQVAFERQTLKPVFQLIGYRLWS